MTSQTLVSAGGQQIVADGGIASATQMLSGAAMTVKAGGTSENQILSNGVIQVMSGFAQSTTIEDGSTQQLYGSAVHTTISSGTQLVQSGGTATSTTIRAGGSQYVSGGGESLAVALSGGTASVDDDAVIQIDSATAGVLNLLSAGGATAIFGTTASTAGTTYTLTTLNASGDTGILGQGDAAAHSEAGQILDIGTLNGSANFVVNTDLANSVSDVIHITTAANSTANTIRVNYDPSANLGEDVTGTAVFATDASSQAVFTAIEGEIGAYSYIPTISSTVGTTTTWSITGLTIAGASEAVYAGLGRAAYTLAAWRDSDAPLYARMAELRQGTAAGLWAAFNRQGQSVDNLGHGVSGTANRIDLGWDKNRGSWHYGIGASYQSGSERYVYGHGTSQQGALSAYALWQGTDGRYAGIVGRIGRLQSDLTTGSAKTSRTSSADSTAWGESLSAAYGFHRELVGGWFIEPEAGLGWAHLGGSDYTLSDGTWLDLRLGWRQDIGSHGSWYCEAGCRAMGGETHRNWEYRAEIDWKF